MEANSMLLCSCPCSLRKRINVTAKAGMSSALAGTTVSTAKRRLSHWQHQLLFCMFPVGCYIQQKGTAGKSPNKQGVSGGDLSQAVLLPSPPIYNRDAHIPFTGSLNVWKWTSRSTSDSLHSFTQSLFLEPYYYRLNWASPKFICWSTNCQYFRMWLYLEIVSLWKCLS